MARFVEQYLPKLRPSSETRYHSSIRALRPHFTGIYLDEINKTKIADYVAARRDVTDATIRRDLACLESMFSRAKSWGWTEKNPVKDYDRKGLRESDPRTRFLSPQEYRSIHEVAPPWLQPIIAIAVGTGMRLGEILALRWSDVDLESLEIAVRDSKTRTPRQVPMSEAVSAQFRAQRPRPDSSLIFQRTGNRPMDIPATSRAFGKAAERASLPEVRFHDLRHTFASWAVQAGADLHRVGKVLGHKGPQMTQRYAHLRTEDLHAVVGRVGTNLGTAQTDQNSEKLRRARRSKV